jgi:hypothetical protein
MSQFTLLLSLVPIAGGILALGLALFVLSQNARVWTNRLLAGGLLLFGLHQVLLLAADVIAPGPWRSGLFRTAFGVAALFPCAWLAFTLSFGRKNGGRHPSAWISVTVASALLAPAAWFGMATGAILVLLHAGPQRIPIHGVDTWGKAYFSMYILALALILLQLENLYRHAAHLTRWKIRYLVVGMFLVFSVQIVAASHALLYGILHPFHGTLTAIGFLAGESLMAFALIRHRLLDVDIFISRYVVYQSLALALVGGYLVALGLVAELFQWLDMPLDLFSGTLLAILGATALAVLLLSEDIRRRTKLFINTHFYKHKYDYRTEWMEYTRRLSKATDIPEIAAQTAARILEVMWVRQVAIYATGPNPHEMQLIHAIDYNNMPDTVQLSPLQLGRLSEYGTCIGTEIGHVVPPAGSSDLAREIFGDVPVGLLAPIIALENLAGLLLVGPEVTGKPFGVDDRDLLAAVAAQAGALMVNARLAQEATEGRELQVLARLSAFVAHDLKNAVSTLSMLADNATRHINNPEFQADVVRGLGEVTSRMRGLLATLSSPGGRPVAGLRATPLGPTVERWLRDLAVHIPPRIRVESRLAHVQDVLVDPEQLRSVLQNLILNAVEAIKDEGTITVEIRTEDRSAVLAISDTGQGMSPDFIRQRLFRPFQTTKARGLGIGLYQCAQIVQQSGGSLTASSEVGKGTCMEVRFPATPQVPPAPGEGGEAVARSAPEGRAGTPDC